MEQYPVPELGPGDLLFRLEVAGLTAEDISPSLYQDQTPPAVPVSEVAAVGDDVTRYNALDRVLFLQPPRDPSTPSLGGLADFIHVPAALAQQGLAVKLTPEIPAEDATLVPAAAAAVRVLREARVPAGGRLLVLGLGLVGQIVILLARHQRVEQIFAADVSPTLRRKAEWSGATRVIQLPAESVTDAVGQEGHGGVHAAVVLSSDPTLLPQAFSALRPSGALILGSPFSPTVRMEVPPAHVRHHEIRLQGVQRFEDRDTREALRAIQQGIVNGEALVSKRIAWRDLDTTTLGNDYWAHGTHVVVTGPEWDEPGLPR